MPNQSLPSCRAARPLTWGLWGFLALLGFLVMVGIGLPQHARADEALQADLMRAISREARRGPWSVEDVSLGAPTEGSRGVMRETRQPFVATLRPVIARFQRVAEFDDVLFLQQTADPEQLVAFEGEALILTGPGMREITVTFADQDLLYRPGEVFSSFPIRNRTVLLVGTPEGDAELARMTDERDRARAQEIERITQLYSGEWIGLRICESRYQEIRLSLEPSDRPFHFRGEFFFQNLTWQPNQRAFDLPRGRYHVTAEYNLQRRQLSVNAGQWIERPSGFNTISWIGFSAEGEGELAVLSGRESGLGCRYRMLRPEAHAAERAAMLGPMQAVLPQIEPGAWIDGSQSGPTAGGQDTWPLRLQINDVTENYLTGRLDLMAFRRSDGAPVRPIELDIRFMLHRGAENILIDFGNPPQVGTQLRNVIGGDRCSARVAFETDTIVITGSGAENAACMREMRLPLVPR